MKIRYTKTKQRIWKLFFSAVLMLLFMGGVKAENMLAKKSALPPNKETKYLKHISDTGDIEQKKTDKTDKTENDILSASGAEEDIEEAITIEAWMLNANDIFWSSTDANSTEEEIEIEEWMTDLSYWQ